MDTHFCTCEATRCPNHPQNTNAGCDPCIRKNLELGEIPSCFWTNISKVEGTTAYSVANFTNFYLAKKAGETSTQGDAEDGGI